MPWKRLLIPMVCSLVLALLIVPLVAGDRDVAELLFEKGEEAFKKRDYEAAAEYFRRSLEEHSPHPEAAFRLGESCEKLGRRPEAIDAYLRCVDEIGALEKPTRKERRLADRAGRLVAKLGKGYGALSKLDAEFVKACLGFGRKHLNSAPRWARKAFESVLAIAPGTAQAKQYMERLADLAPPSEGQGLYVPLIKNDQLSNWSPGARPPWKCSGGLITVDSTSDLGIENDLKRRLEGTYSLQGTFRMMKNYKFRHSHGFSIGQKTHDDGWVVIIDGSNSIVLIRWVEKVSKLIKKKKLIDFKSDLWHVIRVDVEPGNIEVFFNGELMFNLSGEKEDAFDGAPALFVEKGKFQIRDVGVKK